MKPITTLNIIVFALSLAIGGYCYGAISSGQVVRIAYAKSSTEQAAWQEAAYETVDVFPVSHKRGK